MSSRKNQFREKRNMLEVLAEEKGKLGGLLSYYKIMLGMSTLEEEIGG